MPNYLYHSGEGAAFDRVLFAKAVNADGTVDLYESGEKDAPLDIGKCKVGDARGQCEETTAELTSVAAQKQREADSAAAKKAADDAAAAKKKAAASDKDK